MFYSDGSLDPSDSIVTAINVIKYKYVVPDFTLVIPSLHMLHSMLVPGLLLRKGVISLSTSLPEEEKEAVEAKEEGQDFSHARMLDRLSEPNAGMWNGKVT